MIKIFDDPSEALDNGIVIIWDDHNTVGSRVKRVNGVLMTVDGRAVSDIILSMNDPQIQVFDEHGQRKVTDYAND